MADHAQPHHESEAEWRERRKAALAEAKAHLDAMEEHRAIVMRYIEIMQHQQELERRRRWKWFPWRIVWR